MVQVNAKKNVAMRGQAFVVFQSNAHATEGIKNLHQAPFFGKPMEVQWARQDSDVTLTGEQLEKAKKSRRRLITKNYFKSPKFKERMSKKLAQRSKEMQALEQENQNVLDQTLNPNRPPSSEKPLPAKDTLPPPQKKLNEPHSMLILKDLPDVTTAILREMFSKFEGFKEIRHISSKKLALVDFADSSLAALALEAMEPFTFESGESLHINFAKK